MRSVGIAKMLGSQCFQAFSVNCVEMRSVGIRAPRGGGKSPGRICDPMVSHWFSMVLHRSLRDLSQAGGARAEGTGGMRSVGIAEMLWFTTFPKHFQLNMRKSRR